MSNPWYLAVKRAQRVQRLVPRVRVARLGSPVATPSPVLVLGSPPATFHCMVSPVVMLAALLRSTACITTGYTETRLSGEIITK